MTEQPPPPSQPPNPQHQPGPLGGPPPPTGAGRPGELVERFLARLIDGIGLGVIYGILAAVFAGIFLGDFDDSTGEYVLYYLFLSVLTTLISLAYYAYLESNQGATFGKQLMKLKVLGPDGASHPTMEQAIRRNIFLAFGLASIVPIVGQFLGGAASLIAVIMIAVGINGDTAARQGWHDKFAGGTRVVKTG